MPRSVRRAGTGARSMLVLAVLLAWGCGSVGPAPLRVAQVRDPVYPAALREEGVEGRVEVAYAVDADGRIGEVRVLRSEPPGVFDDAVLRALRDWRYEPPTERREDVRSIFEFRLDREAAAAYP